jgi:hypothetical protein
MEKFMVAPAERMKMMRQRRRALADALPPGHPSCHARVFGAAELAAHPDRRVAAIALERTANDLAQACRAGDRRAP